jgi:chemotaxis protein methyltransferase CheR
MPDRPQSDVSALVSAVEQRFGLHLHEGFHTVLADRAFRLVGSLGIRSLKEIVTQLQKAGDQDPLVMAMKEAASIGETYFFRAPKQLEGLEELVVKNIAPAKRALGQKTLRIWSAASATGEELYTLGIMFRRALPDFRLQLVGTDMNPVALAAVKAGVYGKRSLRGIENKIPKELRKEKDREFWAIDPTLKSLVHLVELNLVTDDLPATTKGLAAFDVIVCRNVLIYVDKEKIPLVMAKLSACSNRRAVVLLSAAEYPAGRHLLGFEGLGGGLWFRHEVIAPMPGAAKPAPLISSIPAPVATPAPAKRPVPVATSPEAAKALLAKAKEAADSGDFQQAVNYAEGALAAQENAPEASYLLGIVCSAMGELLRARRELERALFFDRSFIAAEIALGELLAREGSLQEGIRHWQRAKKLLARVDPSLMLPGIDVPATIALRLVDTALKSGGAE